MAIEKFTFLYLSLNAVELENKADRFDTLASLLLHPTAFPSCQRDWHSAWRLVGTQERVAALLPHHFILTEFLLHAQRGKDY